MDTIEDLLKLADAAFTAIAKNTGSVYWAPMDTESESLRFAVKAFDNILATKGLPWLIDSTIGAGMTHLGFTYWMKAARPLIEN